MTWKLVNFLFLNHAQIGEISSNVNCLSKSSDESNRSCDFAFWWNCFSKVSAIFIHYIEMHNIIVFCLEPQLTIWKWLGCLGQVLFWYCHYTKNLDILYFRIIPSSQEIREDVKDGYYFKSTHYHICNLITIIKKEGT